MKIPVQVAGVSRTLFSVRRIKEGDNLVAFGPSPNLGVVDLNNGVFGDESGEGFEFYIEDSSVPYEFTISSGLAGLGETDTCVFFDGGDRCAGGLFQVVKTVESNNGSTQVSEPASFATAMLILFAFTSMRKRKQ